MPIWCRWIIEEIYLAHESNTQKFLKDFWLRARPIMVEFNHEKPIEKKSLWGIIDWCRWVDPSLLWKILKINNYKFSLT